MFPQHEWHRCLRRCCEIDDSRRVVAYQRHLDTLECRTRAIQYREWLGDASEAAAKMNGVVLQVTNTDGELERPDMGGLAAWNDAHVGPGWSPLSFKAAKTGS
jgi:hypothetical protein